MSFLSQLSLVKGINSYNHKRATLIRKLQQRVMLIQVKLKKTLSYSFARDVNPNEKTKFFRR